MLLLLLSSSLSSSLAIYWVLQSESTSSPSNYKDIENDARPFNRWALLLLYICSVCVSFSLSHICAIPCVPHNSQWQCDVLVVREYSITQREWMEEKNKKRTHFHRKLKCQGCVFAECALCVKQIEDGKEGRKQHEIFSILSFIKICKNSYFPLFHCNQFQTFPFQIEFTSDNNSGTKLILKI